MAVLNYYYNNKEKALERNKEYYQNNKELIASKHKEYREKNADLIKERKRAYYQRPEVRAYQSLKSKEWKKIIQKNVVKCKSDTLIKILSEK